MPLMYNKFNNKSPCQGTKNDFGVQYYIDMHEHRAGRGTYYKGPVLFMSATYGINFLLICAYTELF